MVRRGCHEPDFISNIVWIWHLSEYGDSQRRYSGSTIPHLRSAEAESLESFSDQRVHDIKCSAADCYQTISLWKANLRIVVRRMRVIRSLGRRLKAILLSEEFEIAHRHREPCDNYEWSGPFCRGRSARISQGPIAFLFDMVEAQ
jgi:hypothetical protein